MNRYTKLVRWAGTKPWFAPIGRYVVTPIDKRLRGSGVTLTGTGTTLPVGYLTTMGRRSGEARTVPLLFVRNEDGRPAVVGTNFGGDDHPAWTLNLEADPDCWWRPGPKAPDELIRARLVDGAERERLWSELLGIWPGYEGYVERSGRRPKLFVLDERS